MWKKNLVENCEGKSKKEMICNLKWIKQVKFLPSFLLLPFSNFSNLLLLFPPVFPPFSPLLPSFLPSLLTFFVCFLLPHFSFSFHWFFFVVFFIFLCIFTMSYYLASSVINICCCIAHQTTWQFFWSNLQYSHVSHKMYNVYLGLSYNTCIHFYLCI